MIFELTIKILVSGLLAAVAAAAVVQIYRVWFDRTVILGAFDYFRDGKPAQESGPYFKRLVSQHLRDLAELYSGRHSRGEFSIPSTDQLGRGRELELPALRESVVDDVELQAYGVKLGGLWRSARRWIESPREITGSVSERGTTFSIFAKTNGLPREREQRTWAVTEPGDMERAAFVLACRLFRFVTMNDPSQGDSGRWIANATDTDFCMFTETLQAYEQYRERLAELGKSDATAALSTTEGKIAQILKRPTTVPYGYKLAAYVYHESGKDDAARNALALYTRSLRERSKTDDGATKLAAALEPQKTVASARTTAPTDHKVPAVTKPAASDEGTVSAGMAIEAVSMGQFRETGVICCFVKDDVGIYLLTADHVLEGERGQTFVTLRGSQKVIATLSRRLPANDSGTAGGAAIARLETKPRLEVPGIGQIRSVIATKDDIFKAESLRAVLPRGVVKTHFVELVTDLVAAGRDRRNIRLRNAIMTTAFSQAGDSGAPVFADGKLVGMVYAGSDRVTVVLPIEPILTALNVTLLE